MDLVRAAIVPCVALAWAVGFACGSPSAFVCEDDMQCVQGSTQGRCENTGYCSFPDGTCDSGHRYGDRAPNGLAEACTEDAATTTTPAADGDDPGADDDAPDPDGLPGDDGGSSDGGTPGTTGAIDPDSGPATGSDAASDPSTSSPPETSTSNDGGSESDTGPLPATCEVSFEDEFDDTELGPEWWGTWSDDGVELIEANGSLSVVVPPAADWIGAGAGLPPTVMAGGWARVEITELAQPELAGTVGLTIHLEDCLLQIEITGEQLVAYTNMGGSFTEVGLAPWPGSLPTWLQLRVDEDETVHWEWSEDLVQWNELHSGVVPGCGDGITYEIGIFGGAEIDGPESLTRRLESFTLCEPI